MAAGAGASPSGGVPALNLPGIAYNVAGLLCYILWPVACIIFLLVGPYNRNRFVRFHAFQAAFLGLAGILVAMALLIVTSILSLIPLLGWLMSSLVWMVYGTGLLVLAIVLMYKAYNGEQYRLPVIGELAVRQAENLQ